MKTATRRHATLNQPASLRARSSGHRRTGRPLRILHVISSLEAGGAERVLLTLLCGLSDMSQTVALAESGSLLPLVPSSVVIRPGRTEIQLANLMIKVRPDVIHTWFDGNLRMAMPPAAQLGIPLVHRLCSVASVHKTYEPDRPGDHAMVARALGAAACVVALSAAAAEDAVQFYGIERPVVIHNGFPLAGRREADARAIPESNGHFIILTVARLVAGKGHADLIDALGRIAHRHPQVELWLAGVGPLETDLRRQAAEAGIADRVQFLGFREDVTTLHAAADLFAFPSVFEGFPNAVGEALRAGLPIVATDLPVIRHDILKGEPAAALVPVGDVPALAATIDRLVSDTAMRAALGASARRAGDRFPVGRMLDEYRAVYSRLAEEARAAA